MFRFLTDTGYDANISELRRLYPRWAGRASQIGRPGWPEVAASIGAYSTTVAVATIM